MSRQNGDCVTKTFTPQHQIVATPGPNRTGLNPAQSTVGRVAMEERFDCKSRACPVCLTGWVGTAGCTSETATAISIFPQKEVSGALKNGEHGDPTHRSESSCFCSENLEIRVTCSFHLVKFTNLKISVILDSDSSRDVKLI